MARTPIRRRAFLRCASASSIAIALPPLASLVRPGDARAGTAPENFVLFHFPSGVHMPDWATAAEGRDYVLPEQLEPLADHRDRFALVSGLSSPGGAIDCSFGGPHERPLGSMLTGADLDCAGDPTHHSVDVEVAQTLGPALWPIVATRPYRATTGGAAPISFTGPGPGTGLSPALQPRALFDQLFGKGFSTEEFETLRARRLSVLDFVREDIAGLRPSLGGEDRVRLERHLDAVRELEVRADLDLAECTPPPVPADDGGDYLAPELIPARVETLMDLSVLALRCGLTRVLNVAVGPSICAVPYPFLDAGPSPIEAHQITHLQAGETPEEAAFWFIQVVRWHISMFARLLDRLVEVDAMGTSLLDRSLVVGLSEMSFAGIHSPFNLPVLAAGAGLEGNRHIHFPCAIENPDQNNWGYDQNRLGCEDGERTPLANLWLTVLRTLGSRAPTFGESTGTLDGLWR